MDLSEILKQIDQVGKDFQSFLGRQLTEERSLFVATRKKIDEKKVAELRKGLGLQ